LPELNAEAATAVHNQFSAIAGGIATLSRSDVINLVKQLQTLSQQAAQDVGAAATLSGAPGGGALASANEQLSVLQQVYCEPVKPDLVAARIKEMREAGVTTAVRVSPQHSFE